MTRRTLILTLGMFALIEVTAWAFVVATAHGDMSAWLAAAAGAVAGGALAAIFAARRWSQPFEPRAFSLKRSLVTGLVGGSAVLWIDAVPATVRAAFWGLAAGLIFVALIETLHRQRLTPAGTDGLAPTS